MKYLDKKPFSSKPPTEAYSDGWERTFGSHPAPVASPAPAPDAGEAAPASVWLHRDGSYSRAQWAVCGSPEDCGRIVPSRVARYVLATPNATDEERVREFANSRRGMDAYVVNSVKGIVALLATIRTERDAAHRAEVAEAEARAYERAASEVGGMACQYTYTSAVNVGLTNAAARIRALRAK